MHGLKHGFNSILGMWGVYLHPANNQVALVHQCRVDETPPLGSIALSEDGCCLRCHKRMPEEIAQAALLVPNLQYHRYTSLYEDK